MNLWNLLMLKLRAAFTVHEADASVHHVKYTDAEAVTAVENESEISLGVFSSVTQHKCHIFNDSNFTVPNGAWTLYPMNAIEYNTGSMANLANNRIDIKKTGIYLVTAHLDLQDPPAGCDRHFLLYVNTDQKRGVFSYTKDYRLQLETSFVIALTVGDYITMEIYQNSGGNLTAYGHATPYGYSYGIGAARIY